MTTLLRPLRLARPPSTPCACACAFPARRGFATPPPPPRAPVVPTTFASKAVPRAIHERPEAVRPMPPRSPSPSSNTAGPGAARDDRTAAGPRPQPREEGFTGPSRPRMVYDRPKEARALPGMRSRVGLYVAMGALGAGAWGVFLLYATNSERLASSPLRQITYQLRNDPHVADVLGERVRYAPNWWGFGEPWISGTVNLMQGKVDLKFRIQGSKGAGTVYFTSIRPGEEKDFRIVRYKLVADDGQVVQLKA